MFRPLFPTFPLILAIVFGLADSSFGVQLTTRALLGGSIQDPPTEVTVHSSGAQVVLRAIAQEGFVFTGWRSDPPGVVEKPHLSTTVVTVTTDTEVDATFSPIAGNRIHNGHFSNGLQHWSPWSGTNNPPDIEVIEKRLILSGDGFQGGVFQSFETGGVGRTITVTGSWSGRLTSATDTFAEVWAIDSDRIPAFGVTEIDGVSDAIRLFEHRSAGDWEGSIPITADQSSFRISFVASGESATLLLTGGNTESATSHVAFDNLEVHSVPAPATEANPPDGFSIRSLEFSFQGINRIAEHPLTGDIYAVNAFGNSELFRIDPNQDPMSATLGAELKNVGLEFESWSSGLRFDSAGNLYAISHDGDLILGEYHPGTESYTWSSLYDFNDTLGLSPVGDHGFGEIAIDEEKGKIYINYGAIERGRGNSEPEPDNGYNTRILEIDMDGTNLQVFSQGVRHDFGLTIRKDGALFGVENSNDCHSAESVHFLERGKHYGYPYNFGTDRGPNDTGLFVCEETPALGEPYSARMANYGPDGRPGPGQPGYIDGGVYWGLHPHSSPNGIEFYDPEDLAENANPFPEEFHHRAFVARFGRQVADSPDVGYDVLSLRMDDLNGGFVCNTFLERVGRVIHLLPHSNGNLYIAIYSPTTSGASNGTGNSRLLEVSYQSPPLSVPDWRFY